MCVCGVCVVCVWGVCGVCVVFVCVCVCVFVCVWFVCVCVPAVMNKAETNFIFLFFLFLSPKWLRSLISCPFGGKISDGRIRLSDEKRNGLFGVGLYNPLVLELDIYSLANHLCKM